MKGYSKRKVTVSSTVFSNNGGGSNGFGGGGFIGYNQSARTQFDASEITHYDNQYIRQFVGIDLSQNQALPAVPDGSPLSLARKSFRSWPNM